MSSELKLLEKVQKRRLRKLSNESVRFRGVRSATHSIHYILEMADT